MAPFDMVAHALTFTRLFSDLAEPSVVDVEPCSNGWYLNYTITNIKDQSNVLSMTFDLPASNVFVVLRRAFRSGRPKHFSFPLGFSDDLRQITVLGIVLRMVPIYLASGLASFTFQSQNMVDVPIATGQPS